MNTALFSSATDEWATPQWLFDALHARFGFTLDVCAAPGNAKLPRYFSLVDDGLAQSWQGERCFCNPPYGKKIGLWVAKARMEAEGGCLVVGLLPARTDTRWWQDHVLPHADLHFVPGRLKFGNADNSAPFPSAIAIWAGMNFLHAPKNRDG
jgi:site-specific DNA-methyltransferase (adenine-specific)